VVDPLTGAAFSLVRCGSCGMGRTEPQPADLAPYYPAAYYGGRHGATAGFCVRRRLRLLNTSSHYLISLLNLLPQRLERDEVKRLSKETKIWRSGHRADGGKLLDIGCGDGSFLLAAQAQGWVVTGVERFPEDAREKGLEVFTDVRDLQSPCTYLGSGFRNPGFRPKAPLVPCSLNPDLSAVGIAKAEPCLLNPEPCPLSPAFDCITLWHSLEHIADPFALLGEVSALLKPGGRVIVAVPDNGGWQARLFGRFWLHLDVPRHLWHFTGPALGEAFQKAGLEVVQTVHQEFEYDLLGWSQSALNALFKTPNVFFNWLTKKPTGVGMPMLVVQVALGLGLTGLSLPLVWLGSLFRRGGTLVVVGGRSVLGTGGTVGTVGH
jgi:SAM-dependent methyltransferase